MILRVIDAAARIHCCGIGVGRYLSHEREFGRSVGSKGVVL